MNNQLIENEIIVPSYTHYGGYSGFQDYGIIGTKIKNKLVEHWKELFLNDDILIINEIECPTIVPECILKASGHVDKFYDYIIIYNNKTFRADHLVKEYAKTNNITIDVNTMTKLELEKFINDNKIFDANIQIDELNLMYKLNDNISYLRPEIAQTIFCNYDRFRKFFKKDSNFGIAQIGKSYRREISPQRFTRMREFTQAEIEYFFDPYENQDHLVNNILDKNIPILSATMQQQMDKHSLMQIREIIDNDIIKNKILLYFLYKISLFTLSMNIPSECMRFRQHQNTEMAHYASECWDLEIFVDNDWLECVGCANRGCYDLKTHSGNKNNCLIGKRKLKIPVYMEQYKINLDKKRAGNYYESSLTILNKYLSNLDKEEILKIKINGSDFDVNVDGQTYTIIFEMLNFVEKKILQDCENYYPHVIEPSFGIDRLMYSIMYHNYAIKINKETGKEQFILKLPNVLSPYDFALFSLQNDQNLLNKTGEIHNYLKKQKYDVLTDNSTASLGSKYTRADKIGITYSITIDYTTLSDNTVTIRNIVDCSQKRILFTDIKK